MLTPEKLHTTQTRVTHGERSSLTHAQSVSVYCPYRTRTSDAYQWIPIDRVFVQRPACSRVIRYCYVWLITCEISIPNFDQADAGIPTNKILKTFGFWRRFLEETCCKSSITLIGKFVCRFYRFKRICIALDIQFFFFTRRSTCTPDWTCALSRQPQCVRVARVTDIMYRPLSCTDCVWWK